MVAPFGNFGFWAMVSLFLKISMPIAAFQSFQPRIRIGFHSNGVSQDTIQLLKRQDRPGDRREIGNFRTFSTKNISENREVDKKIHKDLTSESLFFWF